jgi:23S rRNA pseudouridine2605 synthase
MRLNKYLAASTMLSRRGADQAILEGRVSVNGGPARAGANVEQGDTITLDGAVVTPRIERKTLLLNKPVGYVCSRNGQGSRTVYDLLPPEFHHLKPVGRLDKDSSGLLLMTDDGELAQSLTHPSKQKVKIYEVTLDKPLETLHLQWVKDSGVTLEDGPSRFLVEPMEGSSYRVTMTEGRNRQIRRTFEALGYGVKRLHRVCFGPYMLHGLDSGSWQLVQSQ